MARGSSRPLTNPAGSTPKALKQYGIPESAYGSDAEMFDLIHAMRSRIATAPCFTGDKVIGAILFEMTMDREIAGRPAAEYLWEERRVVPFLKIDNGLEAAADGVQMMKQIPDLAGEVEARNRKGHLRDQGALGHRRGERGWHQGQCGAAVSSGGRSPRPRSGSDPRA